MLKPLLATTALAATLLGYATAANAALSLMYSTDGGTTYTTVNDNGVGDLSGTAGTILVLTGPNSFINVGSSISNALPGISSLHINSQGGPTSLQTLSLIISATGYAGPASLTSALVTGGLSGSALTGTGTATTWINPDNTLFDKQVQSFTGSVTKTGTFGGGLSNSIFQDLSGDYGLTVQLDLSLTCDPNSGCPNAGQLNVTASEQVEAIPEPATLGLLGLGLALVGLRRRKRA